MPKSATIAVDGRLVKWARESAGLSLEAAAKKAKVRPAVFAEWERTKAYRTARQLEALADAFKRPVASFFLPEPPREPALPADFRMVPAQEAPSLSFETRLAIRRARRLQRIFRELSAELGEADHPPRLRITRNEPPEEAGTRARDALGVAIEDQARWEEPEVALKAWRASFEALGVLVFQFAMEKEKVSGFSLSNGVPVIVLNRRDTEARRIFTLAHEWGHLLLGEPGLCSVEEGRVSREENVEVYCNAFAAALLVPLGDFETSPPVLALRKQRASLEKGIEGAVQLFAVSREVILRRLLTARTISRETYQQTLDAWNRARRPAAKKKGGFALPHTVRAYELGVRFISRVLAAHERGLVTDGDVADYLSLRLKHLGRLQQALPGA